ncbi:MAG: gamma-glutamyltransferase [Phycisphaerales bacterium]|nr:gamma-glutamyltransferase [Phycisphaerales bacterium]
MTAYAVACGTDLAARTGAEIADAGGNAVDVAVAATFMTWVAEPGMTSVGGGGFATVWPADGDPVTIDGFVEMPGRAAPLDRFGHAHPIVMPYGGETHTIIGAASVATPGALAALEHLAREHGRLPWRRLVEPAAHAAREGFPLPRPSHTYMTVARDTVFSATPDVWALAHRPDGTLRDLGEVIHMPDLAQTLDAIAYDGAAALYEGEIGRRITDWLETQGGLLGPADLAAYRAVVRPALRLTTNDWTLATNPAPAVGGAALIDLLTRMIDPAPSAWDAPTIARFACAMDATFAARHRMLGAPSTSHTSAVDASGLACSITTSTGYSSGIIVPGTGVLLNNILGEIELFPGGLHGARPGARVRSNMAPSIARTRRGETIALGAAGADRITSALAQVWLHLASLGLDLHHAVASPRCHLEQRAGIMTLAAEPGIDLRDAPYEVRRFDEPHMYFGGVQAAMRAKDGAMSAVAEPRRGGGVRTSCPPVA